MGPGALDFHDSNIYSTIVDRFYKDEFNDEELVYYKKELVDVRVDVESHKSISRDDMLAIFELIATPDATHPNGIVTSDEFHDLQLIADVIDLDENDPDDPSDNNDSPFRLQMVGYDSNSNDLYKDEDLGYVCTLTKYIADGVKNGEVTVIDGIEANDSGTDLDNLVNKWFKGTDRPDSDLTYTYQDIEHTLTFNYAEATTDSLFINGTAVGDMQQGALGDCYFIAALGSIADAGIDGDDQGETSNGIADAIEDMFIGFDDNNDGVDDTWVVRFYDANGKANYVTVDNQLPVHDNNLLVYANGGGLDVVNGVIFGGQNISSTELWMPLLEKAYAQWNETDRAEQDGENSYAGISGGYSDIVYKQVLGTTASRQSLEGLDDTEKADAQSLLDSELNYNHPVVASISGHAWVVTGIDANDKYLRRNPYYGSVPYNPISWDDLYTISTRFYYADSSGTTTLHSLPIDSGDSSGFISSDTMAAVFAALSTSQAAGESDHNELATKATENGLSDLAIFEYDRVDAALANDLSGQVTNESLLDDWDAIGATSNDRLDRDSALDAVDMLFSDMESSLIGKILPGWDTDLPGLG